MCKIHEREKKEEEEDLLYTHLTFRYAVKWDGDEWLKCQSINNHRLPVIF